MLTNAAVMATIPVADMARARRFYEQALGLLYECGRGTRLFLFQRQPTKADHTAFFKDTEGNVLAVSQFV